MDVTGKNQQALAKINFFSEKVKNSSNIEDLFSELFSLVNLESVESSDSQSSLQNINENSQKTNIEEEKTLNLASSLVEIFYEELGINAFSEKQVEIDNNSRDINKNFFKNENINLVLNQNFPKDKLKLKINEKSLIFNKQNNRANSDIVEIRVKTALGEKKFHDKDIHLKNSNSSNLVKIDDNLNIKNEKKIFEVNYDKNNNKNGINNSENLVLKKSIKKNKQFFGNANEKNIEIKKSSLSEPFTKDTIRNQVSTKNSIITEREKLNSF